MKPLLLAGPRYLFILLLLVFLTVSCRATPQETATVIPSATAPPTRTPAPSNTPAPTATNTPVPTPTLTPTPAPLTPSLIFDRISPSVAFVETQLGSGSGILIEGNYLLTNAHVVWPYEEARVVFADGTEFADAPVHNWDLMADLALIGPLEGIEAPPLALANGESLIVGSNVYLVGYPGEVEKYPEPSITSGLISRQREWGSEEITFLQVDASVAGGQSGGALVSEMGDVIGLSGFAFTEVRYGLVASASDIALRLEKLAAGEDSSGLGSRLLPRNQVSRQHTVRLAHYWDSAYFLVEETSGDSFEVEANSIQDVSLHVLDSFGNLSAAVDDGDSGIETVQVADSTQGPYYVGVTQYGTGSAFINLSSEARLVRLDDPDDDRNLLVDRPMKAAIDHPGDIDFFRLRLAAGEVVNLYVDSASIDPSLTVTYLGAGAEQEVADDDSGGGLWGVNADLTYRAPHSGLFLVIVRDATQYLRGGYTLTAHSHREGAPTPVAPVPTPVPTIGPAGHPMLRYEGEQFSLLGPSWWTDASNIEAGCYSLLCVRGEQGWFEVLSTEDAAITSRSQLANALSYGLRSMFSNVVQKSWTTIITEAGESVDVVHFTSSENGEVAHIYLMAAFRDGTGLAVVYLIDETAYVEDELALMVEHSFSTFEWK